MKNPLAYQRYETNLSVSYLVLHLPGLFRRSTEKENTAGQPVQPVDCPQILQVVLLRQNEYNRVVPVSSARVHLQFPTSAWFICWGNRTRSGNGDKEDRGLCNRLHVAVKNIYSARETGKAKWDYCIIVFAGSRSVPGSDAPLCIARVIRRS